MDDSAFISADYFLTRPVAGVRSGGERPPSQLLTLDEHRASSLPSAEFLEGSDPWPGHTLRNRSSGGVEGAGAK